LINNQKQFLEFEGNKSDKEILKYLEKELNADSGEILIKNKRNLKYYGEDINIIFASLDYIEIENEKFRNFDANIDNIESLYIEIAYDYSLCYEMREYDDIRKNQVLGKKEKSIKKIDLIFSVIVGLLFGISLFYNAEGINTVGVWTTFVSFVIGGYLLWFKGRNIKSSTGVAVLITGAALSITFSIFSNEVFRAINIFVVPIFILGGIRLAFTSEIEFVFLGFLKKILYLVIVSPLTHAEGIKILALFRTDKKRTEKSGLAKDIIIGLIISIPILGILGAILASASSQFASIVVNLVINLFNFNLSSLENLIFGFIVSVAIFAYMVVFLNTMNVQFDGGVKIVNEKKEVEVKLNVRILNTVLIMINGLYLVFVLSTLNQEVETFSSVAREGFFQLVFVVLLNIIMIMFFRGKTKENKISKVLYAIMTALSLCMAASSIKSLVIYIGGYGLTRLRFISIVFVGFLMILLVVLLINIFKKFKMWNYIIIIAMIFYIGVNYINMDAYIVKYNVNRYTQSGDERLLDVDYLTSLSYDAKFEIADGVDKGYFNKDVLKKFKSKDLEWFDYNYYECSNL
jgi:hypothetical protein